MVECEMESLPQGEFVFNTNVLQRCEMTKKHFCVRFQSPTAQIRIDSVLKAIK